jgi:hypothetical protein
MDSRSVVRRRVAADPSPFSRRFPLVSFQLPLQTVCRAFHTSGTRESGIFKFHPLHSFGCKAHSWRCILIARVTKRYRAFALLLLSANITLFYIMTACWADSSRAMVPVVSCVRSRRQSIHGNSLHQQRQSFDDNSLQQRYCQSFDGNTLHQQCQAPVF